MGREIEHYRRRAAQERQAARTAAHPLARDAHLQMAELYDVIVTQKSADVTSSSSEFLIPEPSRNNA